MQCSLGRSLDVIGDWWSPLIIRDLAIGLRLFDELVEDLGISRNLLAARLKALDAGGIIQRRAYQQNPLRYEYSLTRMGTELIPIFAALTAWGDRWVCPDGGPPMLFGHKTCGAPLTPELRCEACGDVVTPETLSLHRGPGARSARGTKLIGRD